MNRQTGLALTDLTILSRTAALLSPRGLDPSSETGRAQERHRRVVLSALASVLAKAISVGTALVSVPLTLHHLGPERYGMWMTMSSLVAMFAFADLGIGNGVLNAVAASHGRDDRLAIRGFVSSGFFALSAIGLCLVSLFAIAYPFVDWFRIFNVETALARSEAGPALAVLLACFALAVPLGIVQRVQMGLQRGFLASLWQCAGSVMGLVGVLVAVRCGAGLPWLVLAFAGLPLLAGACNTLLFFGWLQPDIAPSPAAMSRTATGQVARTGALFFILQIVAAVAYSADTIVIAQMLGAARVAAYAVPERMFGIIAMLVSMVLTPLWPAYGEALARGDRVWARRTFKRSLLSAISLAAVLSAILLIAGPRLIALWVGHAIEPSIVLLAGLAIWKVVEAGGTALAVFLNGAHVVRPQVIAGIATAICAIVLKIVLVGQIGAPGVVWASIVAYCLFTALPVGLLLPKILK